VAFHTSPNFLSAGVLKGVRQQRPLASGGRLRTSEPSVQRRAREGGRLLAAALLGVLSWAISELTETTEPAAPR